MNLSCWTCLHPSARAALFLALCMRAALERQWLPQSLLFCGLLLLLFACGAAAAHYRFLLWVHLMGLPSTMLLFVAIGYEQTRAIPQALLWGAVEALKYALRVETVLLVNLLFISVTSTREIFALFPRRWMPVSLATLLATALRFVPLSLVEARRIYDVQRCRGQRVRPWAPRSWLPILIPLFVSQMCRAHDTAVMLVVRRIGVAPAAAASRKWTLPDVVTLAIALALCVQIVL
jgi:energy-coupling factor transporter transmembrane protein EcfT